VVHIDTTVLGLKSGL